MGACTVVKPSDRSVGATIRVQFNMLNTPSKSSTNTIKIDRKFDLLLQRPPKLSLFAPHPVDTGIGPAPYGYADAQ